MKSQFILLSTFVLGAAVSLPVGAESETAGTPRHVGSPEALLTQVLEAERRGDVAQRDELIEALLLAEPELELARWLKGQVEFQGMWMPVDRVKNFVTSDRRWREYNERVESLKPSVASHAALARWCRSQNLENEERWHWFNVLWHNPGHREAQGSLGVKPYLGDFFTTEQIAANEQSQRQAKADLRRFSAELQQLIRDAELGDSNDKGQALAKIREIDDPAAIPALIQTVLDNERTENRIINRLGKTAGPELVSELQQAMIDSLSGMIEHQATMGLLEIALYAPKPDIRHYSATALKPRPETDYVPLLMGSLAKPIEASFAINVVPNGPVLVEQEFSEVGPQAATIHQRSSTHLTQRRVLDRRPLRDPPAGLQQARPRIYLETNTPRDLARATTQVAAAQQQVAIENQVREQRNAKINEVLEVVTDQQFEADPAKWWTAWRQFNELETPEVIPQYGTTERFADTTVTQVVLAPMSCFVAGTPVWTQGGPVPIEEIQVGDLVLSQDPHTGKLAYQPVIDTTVREPSPVVNLSTNTETIGATRGHRFWLTGEGWRMAKLLEPGDRVFAVGGSTDVQNVEPAGEQEAFNLVVAEFHTYFVGNGKLLVHDNSCPAPTVNGIPGVRRTTKYENDMPLAAN